MSTTEDALEVARSQLECLREELSLKSEEVEGLTSQVREANAVAAEAREAAATEAARVRSLQLELGDLKVRCELDKFRALDSLRSDYQKALEREGELKLAEQKRVDEWVHDLKESHKTEKEYLLRRIADLEKAGVDRLTPMADPACFVNGTEGDNFLPASVEGEESESSSEEVEADTDVTGTDPIATDSTAVVSEVVSQPVSPEAVSTGVTTSTSALCPALAVATVISPGLPTSTVTLPVVMSSSVAPTVAAAVSGTVPSSGGMTKVVNPSTGSDSPASVAGMVPGVSTMAGVTTGAEVASGTVIPEHGVLETFTRLLKAQTDVMAAQSKAVAVQNLPSLACYTGEGGDATDDGFERWLERFRERAKFAGWTAEEQLYQLKLHLDKTALDVFRMLPDGERNTIECAVTALEKRFKPADIEELRGLEFHHRAQGGNESIEQLGIGIQQLGRKAFPSITGKDFDRLLKGRFYQALLVKWQRKLGCPKPDEGFHELLARARMLEEHEKQFAASAQTRSETKKTTGDGSKKPSRHMPERQDSTPTTSNLPGTAVEPEYSQPRGRRCYKCKQIGHVRRDCPEKGEAPGRSAGIANTNTVQAAELPTRIDDLTDSQLEKLLADRRLDREKQELAASSQANVIKASSQQAGAVGTLIYVDICIEGTPVRAMVDTGAQSTIISRSTLHAVSQNLKQQGRELPPLELPTVRLYGKDGKKGGNELLITAQAPLMLSLDDRSVSVPVFVQPDSDQACLLGINAIPGLEISVLRDEGKPMSSQSTDCNTQSEKVTVNLVKSTTLPSQKGRIVTATMSSLSPICGDLLFEPDHKVLVPLGVDAHECVITTDGDGRARLPLQNFQGITAHLEAGTQLGTIKSTDVVTLDSDFGDEDDDVSCHAHVKAVEQTPERFQQLYRELNLSLDTLT